MKKKVLPVVRCHYAETGKDLSDILEESFRLYLGRILAAEEEPDVSAQITDGRLVQEEWNASGNQQSDSLSGSSVHPIIQGG